MAQQFFEELSRCLRKEQIESYNKEDRRLEIFLHGQPVLSVSPGNEVFLLPAGSKNPEANELYGRYMIQESGRFEYDENLRDYYDYARYGLERMNAEEGRVVKSGYVSYHGVLTLEELMMDNPAEQYQRNQGFNFQMT